MFALQSDIHNNVLEISMSLCAAICTEGLIAKQHVHNRLVTWSYWPWLPLNDASEWVSCPSLPPVSFLSYPLLQDNVLFDFFDLLKLTTAEYTPLKSIYCQFGQIPFLTMILWLKYFKWPTWIDRTANQRLCGLNLGHWVLRFPLTPSTSVS